MNCPVVKSGELFSFVTSGSRGWAKYYSDTGPAFLRIGNLNHDSILLDLQDIQRVQPPSGTEGTRTRVHPADILISITADVGMVGIVPEGFEEAYINQHVSLARPVSTVYPPYLAWCLSSPPSQRQFRELQRGATKVGLGLSDISAIDIPLPPLTEQRRIVEEIEKQLTRLDSGVSALRRVQANLKRYRAAVLKAACEGRLVPTEAELAKTENRKAKFETGEDLLAHILTERRKNWQGRGQYKEPAENVATDLSSLPNGWAWASLGQLARSSSYGTSAKCSPDNSGPPVLRIPNIAGGQIDLIDLKFARTSESIAPGDELAPGDLLVIRTNGSKNLIGRSAVVRTQLERASGYASYLIRFRLFSSPSLFDWVGTIWDVSFLRAWIEQRAATSAGQHNISMSVLSTMPIPLPPLAEQERIVAEVERRLSVIEELESTVSANLHRATGLRQSILQKAFSGEIVC